MYEKYVIIEKNPFLLITIGIPGCGKSTLRDEYKKKYKKLAVVSYDDIRFKILPKGVFYDPNIEIEVKKKATAKFNYNIRNRTSIFLDATNTTKKGRAMYIEKAKKVGYVIVIVRFYITPEEAIERQKGRARKVSDEVIRKKYLEIEEPEKSEYDKLIKIKSYSK